tara:strand:- start:436 stop:621 length:186 start_codon:yes stop_codon:yes gene_type:complete
MKLYLVTYSGLWLGGEAIVFAEYELEAVALVENDDRTVRFTSVKAEELPMTGVIYNSNGDY